MKLPPPPEASPYPQMTADDKASLLRQLPYLEAARQALPPDKAEAFLVELELMSLSGQVTITHRVTPDGLVWVFDDEELCCIPWRVVDPDFFPPPAVDAPAEA